MAGGNSGSRELGVGGGVKLTSGIGMETEPRPPAGPFLKGTTCCNVLGFNGC